MGIKVSEMAEAESVNDEDLIMIVQNGVNKKVACFKSRNRASRWRYIANWCSNGME